MIKMRERFVGMLRSNSSGSPTYQSTHHCDNDGDDDDNEDDDDNIIIVALKGAIQDFLQSPHCTTNRLQHVRSSDLTAKSCENHVQHIEHLARATCVTCHEVRRDSSAIKFDRVQIAFT